MSRFEMKLPDVGEGVAEAELVEWLVAVGDEVTPDSVLAEVLTDKATVEVASPVAGTVVELHGDPGDVLAVGGDLVAIETADGAVPEPPPPADPDGTPAAAEGEAESEVLAEDESATEPERSDVDAEAESGAHPAPSGRTRALAAPAVRRRAADLGIDLATIRGSGPDGRVVHADLDAALAGATRPSATTTWGARVAADGRRVEPVRGVRRRIAARLSAAWSEIPHITYVEAVDVTELEALRAELNRDEGRHGAVRLTVLPFLVRAIVVACREQPQINAHYDHDAETLTVVDAVHAGIATQTEDGLLVPVVRHAEARDLRDLAAEIVRVTAAAREGRAVREELAGSTITITSLGAIGGVATTPILNPPEVAIVGVNKIEVRPVWCDGSFQPRQMLNLSSSFDHRMVDGWNAATFVQRVRSLLEIPALLFVDP